jgi:hypothetical protein
MSEAGGVEFRWFSDRQTDGAFLVRYRQRRPAEHETYAAAGPLAWPRPPFVSDATCVAARHGAFGCGEGSQPGSGSTVAFRIRFYKLLASANAATACAQGPDSPLRRLSTLLAGMSVDRGVDDLFQITFYRRCHVVRGGECVYYLRAAR